MSIKAKKILNDPVYGFITLPEGLVFELIEHPYFQRLRRIKQVGLTEYVYPGATHSRFHHALGAMHLMQQALNTLQSKGIEISPSEYEAALIAILLHDIGHGPFSHTLEQVITPLHHEDITSVFMRELNKIFNGGLDLAIQIFEGTYNKAFLHQLVSSQLDMDRMDYLNRDSFFTGVAEGVISYDRIIQMLNVKEGNIVVEEKGIYSVEKFLIARRLMYWQVYLHKTVLAAEQQMIKVFQRLKELLLAGYDMALEPKLNYFMNLNADDLDLVNPKAWIDQFADLDDVDILFALKQFRSSKDKVLRDLSSSILDRNIFKLELSNSPFPSDYIAKIRQKIGSHSEISNMPVDYYVFTGSETNRVYKEVGEDIHILLKDGSTLPIHQCSDIQLNTDIITKFYLCYVRI